MVRSGAGARESSDLQAPQTRLSEARAILLDWDGCASFANRPHAAAVEFLHRHGERTAIVSNNSTSVPEEIAQALAAAGVRMPASRIILAGMEALALAGRTPEARCLVLGSPRMRAVAHARGLKLVTDAPDIVVLLRDTRFSYARLQRAVTALRKGARLIVANPDLTHPAQDGGVTPETGALLAAIGACVDLASIDAQVVGKPSPHLFLRACAELKARPQAAVMIGDNPHTDVAGARQLGMAAILVEPGSSVSLRDLLAPPLSRVKRLRSA